LAVLHHCRRYHGIVQQGNRPEIGVHGQGSETSNALAASAIASAVFDATGKPVRRLPLRPEIVRRAMSAQARLYFPERSVRR
jgi:hypothetical protein